MYTVKQLKSDLRQGYAWPGGYEIVFITEDGALLCNACVRDNFRSVLDDMKSRYNTGWRIIAATIEAVSPDCTREMAGEDYITYCDCCNKEFGELQ